MVHVGVRLSWQIENTPKSERGVLVYWVNYKIMKINNKNKKIPIIIDTDPGHDDALAIMLLEKSGLFAIKAITTVAGNSTIQNVTNNAKFIVDLVGCKAPIYSGAEKPLKRELIKAVVHGDSGLDGVDVNVVNKLSGDAVEQIISIVRADPGEVSIVVIGPETNIAEAFIKDPELPKLIKQLVIMGGAIEVPGNKNRVGEFNIFVDPEAADIVFRSAVKKILVPLDVCNDVMLQLEDFERLNGSALYVPLMGMMDKYIKGIEAEENVSGAIMYDPLAAYYLVNPGAYDLEKMDIQIQTVSELTRGMTVADRRNWGDKQPNVEVVRKIASEAFVRDFIDILKK